MAHVGQKFALGSVGLLGGFLGGTQFRDQAAQRIRLLTFNQGCPDLPRNVVIDPNAPR